MYLLFNYVFFFQFIISKKNVPLEDHQSIDSVTVVLTFPPNEFTPRMFLMYLVQFTIIMLYKVVITFETVNQMLTITIQIKVTE